MNRSDESMEKKIDWSDRKIFLQFGGQGGGFFIELKSLYTKEPVLKDFFDHCFEAFARFSGKVSSYPGFEYGLDFQNWLNDKNLPPARYLDNYRVTLSGIFITQLAYYYLFLKKNDKSLWMSKLIGSTGHSQGICASAVISLSLEGDLFFQALKDFINFFILSSIHLSRVYNNFLSQTCIKLSKEMDNQEPSSMVAVTGIDEASLQDQLNEFKSQGKLSHIYIGLKNSDYSFVLVGDAETIAYFRKSIYSDWEQREIKWTYLDITIPFHCQELLGEASAPCQREMQEFNFQYQIKDLKFPVFSTLDGGNLMETQSLEKKLSEILFDLVFLKRMDWKESLKKLQGEDNALVLDFGPGRISHRLTQSLFQNREITILSMANRSDRKLILS